MPILHRPTTVPTDRAQQVILRSRPSVKEDVEPNAGHPDEPPVTNRNPKLVRLALATLSAGFAIYAAELAIFHPSASQTPSVQLAGAIMAYVGSLAVASGGYLFFRGLGLLGHSNEAVARIRLRQAEKQLAELLQRGQPVTEALRTQRNEAGRQHRPG